MSIMTTSETDLSRLPQSQLRALRQQRAAIRRSKFIRKSVDFFEHADDHNCALYAAMGFSTKMIMAETQLSHSQVTYRVTKAGLTKANGASRTDFRNGTSPFAAPFMIAAKVAADRQLIKFLKAHV